MFQRFLNSLEEIVGADFANKNYLLAVSGGADSSVMTYLFNKAKLKFSMAHCNFHLRGEYSDRDMEFVKNMAESINSELFVKEFDTLSLQKDSGKSVEMVARDLRYGWFAELMKGFDLLVTAHNSNDAAETTILNLSRGSGLKGLCSIPPKNGHIIRPLLPFSAKEIRSFANKNSIGYVEDHTNSDQTIKRNKIRHSVVPILEEINPNLLDTMHRNQQILLRQYAFYNKKINEEIANIVFSDALQTLISKHQLHQFADPQLLLFEILNQFGFSNDVCEKITGNPGLPTGKIFSSNTHTLLVDRDYLIVRRNENQKTDIIQINSIDDLSHYFRIESEIYNKDLKFDKNPNVFYIPEEKLHFPIVIRNWRHGDYFYPLGAKGKKKLSDFFATAKINSFEKQQVRLLCCGDDIMWIIGHRSDERYKIDNFTKKYYKITYLNTNNEK